MRFRDYQLLFHIIGVVLTGPSTSLSGVDSSTRLPLVPRQEQGSQFVRRFNHGSFIIGKNLYIDGGEATHFVNGVIDQRILDSTLAIDLSSSFSTLTGNNSVQTQNGVQTQNSVQIQNIDKGLCPNFNFIRFWTDIAANTVYAYGGEFSLLNPWVGNNTVPPESFWSFTPSTTSDGGTWQSLNQSSPVFNSITRPGQGSVASGDIGGFNLGGYAGANESQKTLITGTIPIPGLQFYNFTSQEWFNNSATAYTSHGTAVWSGTVYVPIWGPAGLLVAFGGQTSPNISAFWDGAAYLSMSTISLFNPLTDVWYHQEATGNVPSQRDRFCIVGINSRDNATYEIFLYGGQIGNGYYHGSSATLENNAGLDEVYILSLPSFVWFKANYTSSDPRRDHTCNIAGNRQMLSIGGVNPTRSTYQAAYNDPDPFWQGIKIFDMTTLQWTNYFNASAAPYTAPSAIAARYAAGPRYPSKWTSNGLKNLFTMEPTINSSAPAKPSASASPRINNQTKANRVATVVGCAVGGVTAVLLVSFALVVLLARKRAKQPPTSRHGGLKSIIEGMSKASGPALVHEADTRQIIPQEADSGQDSVQEVDPGQQAFALEADSGLLHELASPGEMRVDHVDVHEM